MHELIDHPCVQHKLAIIRDQETGHKRFRELSKEITKFVCYEALKNIKVKKVTVKTPLADAVCKKDRYGPRRRSDTSRRCRHA